MATKYRLTSEALRVVQSDDKGKVTYRKRYKKGQIVDISKMDQDRVDLFIEKGYLVDAEADVDAPVEDEPETGTDEPEDETDGQEPPEDSEPQDEGTDDAGDTDETDAPEPDESAEDVYDRMPYPELQQEAKSRTGNGAGNAEELRTRLREADAADADES